MKQKRKPRRKSSWRSRFLAILALITIIGGGLRLGVGAELYHSYRPVTRPGPDTDMATYQDYARELLEGRYDFSKGFYFQPFYYNAFLPAVYLIFGGSTWGVVIVQSLLGAACIWLIGLSFAMMFGKRAGLAAAVLLALARYHIFYTPFTLIAVLQSFWMCLLLYLGLWAKTRTGLWRWTVCGLVLGLAIVTRGNVLLFIPPFIALMAWRWRGPKARLLGTIALFLLASYLPQLPYALVNYRVHGRWVGPSSAGPAVLALGNTPEAPPGGLEYPQSFEYWRDQAIADAPDRVPIRQNVWGWIKRQPLAYPELKFRMLLLFWDHEEIPNNVAVVHASGKPIGSRLLHMPGLFDFFLIGSLGLAGLILAVARRRIKPKVLFAAAIVVIYAASIILFYVLARFRVPLVPVLCGFGGAMLARAWELHQRYRKYGAERKHPALIAAILVYFSCFFQVGFGYSLYRLVAERHVTRLVRPSGVQVDLPGKLLALDNGPFSFGGWTPVEVKSPLSITKRFAVPPRTPEQANEPRLRQALFSDAANRGRVSATGPRGLRVIGEFDIDEVPAVNDPANWAELPLQAGEYEWTDAGLSVTLLVESLTSEPVVVLVDIQRDYGRTQLTPAPEDIEGELVMHLDLPK